MSDSDDEQPVPPGSKVQVADTTFCVLCKGRLGAKEEQVEVTLAGLGLGAWLVHRSCYDGTRSRNSEWQEGLLARAAVLLDGLEEAARPPMPAIDLRSLGAGGPSENALRAEGVDFASWERGFNDATEAVRRKIAEAPEPGGVALIYRDVHGYTAPPASVVSAVKILGDENGGAFLLVMKSDGRAYHASLDLDSDSRWMLRYQALEPVPD